MGLQLATDAGRIEVRAEDRDGLQTSSEVEVLEGPERKLAAYGEETWRRLQLVKAAWDPENVFRVNHNISPA